MKRYQRDTFDCGCRVLNEYLKKYARQNHQKVIAKTFVAIPALGGLKVDGYYTISLISSFIHLLLLKDWVCSRGFSP
ncbi:MAG: hypothetical protein RIG63_28990 [Coleofasciculus chthonoplastes F3-SA18-01]